ncbi:hypothetical protein B0H67DRAFT_55040 [Lasiosphaeris hirsuta]|uniref:Uncharacterized protein n=1 Tax=Lasiosphaeris hirsuta TaxID=260670 RepID=A0AA40BB27_9PEZI|nr:hypothetical protein B0H67DRAFT_55040 [Lasiosphaeris hirsuta]
MLWAREAFFVLSTAREFVYQAQSIPIEWSSQNQIDKSTRFVTSKYEYRCEARMKLEILRNLTPRSDSRILRGCAAQWQLKPSAGGTSASNSGRAMIGLSLAGDARSGVSGAAHSLCKLISLNPNGRAEPGRFEILYLWMMSWSYGRRKGWLSHTKKQPTNNLRIEMQMLLVYTESARANTPSGTSSHATPQHRTPCTVPTSVMHVVYRFKRQNADDLPPVIPRV